MNAIETVSLSKRYGRSEVLRDVDLAVKKGVIFVLVGPNGAGKISLTIGGYALGFLGLATLQAAVVLGEAIWLFELDYEAQTLATLFLVVWLLAIASVMLGIFISTFARHEGQVFPFIPLIILPSVFLSGLLVDVDKLPDWAGWLGHAFPLFYANDVIQEIITPDGALGDVWGSFIILAAYGVGLLILASLTLREVE